MNVHMKTGVAIGILFASLALLLSSSHASAQDTVHAELGALPIAPVGSCPTTIHFRGKIVSARPGTIRYTFTFSDGGVAPVNTLDFKQPGAREVTYDWSLGRCFTGWVTVHVISPVDVESNKAYFNLICITPTVKQALSTSSPNMLLNPDFSVVGPSGTSTSYTGNAGAGPSAADRWILFNNGPATITTELLRSTRPGGSAKMIHVNTTGGGSGLVQAGFASEGTYDGVFSAGPPHVIDSAWVYVVRGKVGIGAGNGGNTSIDAVSTTTGRWEFLQGCNVSTPVNEFLVYSMTDGAEFYVDFAKVTQISGVH